MRSGDRVNEMSVNKSEVEIASKRVALTHSTWATLSSLRRPGQTFDDTISELITEHQNRNLIADLDEIDATDKTISWDQAKKNLGLL